jgi:hypothetical protein
LGAFGEKLRKQRELRGIELDAISNTTKISTRLLRALEDEHFDQLPGGVFNKGFVRAYARQVGLNEDETIADYLAALHGTQMQAHSTSSDSRDPGTDPPGKDLPGKDLAPSDSPGNNAGDDPSRQLLTEDRRKGSRRNEDRRNQDRDKQDRRNADGRYKDLSFLPSSSTPAPAAHPPAARFRQKYPAGGPEQPPHSNEPSVQIPWGKLAMALLLVTFALALWNSRRHREPTAALPSAVASNRSPAPAPVTAATSPNQSRSAASLPADKTSPGDKTSPAATSSSGKLSGETVSGGTASGGTVSAAAQTESTTGSATTPLANSPRPNPTVAEGAASTPATRPGKLSLLIRAEETAWVSIVADGKPVAQETLIAPAHTSVRATGEVVVKTGNAAGISFQLNGKEIPAQGDEGEVKTYVFDAAGFRVLPQPQSPAPNR